MKNNQEEKDTGAFKECDKCDEVFPTTPSSKEDKEIICPNCKEPIED